MLVENKFIFISLPRCASTSFYISCIKNELDIQHYNDFIDIQRNQIKNLTEIKSEEIADFLIHGHEPIVDLIDKFGSKLDIISINRNRYERFISLWKHVIDEYHRIGEISEFNKLIKLNVDDILFFNQQNLNNIDNVVDDFIKLNKLNIKSIYLKDILKILFRPTSYYHKHHPDIIWFDFNELNKLEEWISEKLNFNFKLERINSSQHFNCNLELNDKFIEKYNNIYDIFDLPRKSKKTLF